MPADILATFAGGWRSSASTNGTRRRWARAAPTVVLPEPETPMTVTSILAVLSRRPAVGAARRAGARVGIPRARRAHGTDAAARLHADVTGAVPGGRPGEFRHPLATSSAVA